MSRAQFYLVSYDIACPRRWRRVFKTLKAAGEHQQLSVFLCRLRPGAMARLSVRLSALIDPSEDRLMIVSLGAATEAAARLRGTAVPAILQPPVTLVL